MNVKCESHLVGFEVKEFSANRTHGDQRSANRTYKCESNLGFWAVAQFRESARFLRDLVQKRYFQVF